MGVRRSGVPTGKGLRLRRDSLPTQTRGFKGVRRSTPSLKNAQSASRIHFGEREGVHGASRHRPASNGLRERRDSLQTRTRGGFRGARHSGPLLNYDVNVLFRA